MASRATRQKIRGDHTDNIRRRCETQKVCYHSYTEARDCAERLMEAGHVGVGCHIVPYNCNRCGYWHVTNRRINFYEGWWR